MERKLASIQKIVKIEPIEGADAIERATILGWQCVVKKGEFKPGDYCVYCEVDSLLPVKPEFEFLRKSCFNPRLNGFRIKTVKLRGQISQGIAFPMSVCQMQMSNPEGEGSEYLPEGWDVTELMGIRKYEPEIHASLRGDVKGVFPSFMPKTDETRIQSAPDVLTRHPGFTFIATEKMDGTSSTFYVKDGEFGVCGRNMEYKPTVENTYWEVAKKYELENKLKACGLNIAIQGEICGPGIQKNKYALSEFKLFVYHVFDLDSYKYLEHKAAKEFCRVAGLEMVPTVEENFTLEEKLPNIEAAVAFATGKSLVNPNIQREGVVVKSLIESTDPELGRLSFKVINPQFLLKYDE